MSQTEPKILWTEVTKFVGQLNHDLRNHLNAVELQAAFLNEICEDTEAKAEISRLRGMTGEMSAQLLRLSASLARIKVTTMAYQASEFVDDLQAKLALELPEEAAAIEWQTSLGEEALEIDPQLLQEAFLELFRNAFTHGRGDGGLVFAAHAAGEKLEFILREPKATFQISTENWGARPFGQIRHGHYGLGLFRARGIFEAHHGNFQALFDPTASALVTTVSLPRLNS
ncbi:MAG: HAMP domain-containing histidine kinase [Chthoniobacterales bacterium]|nr:HAMP domain-containing histidine kinase [Chthoniobacterales bacterium]